MKKVISLVLAISMLLALAIPAFAGNEKVINTFAGTAKSDFNNAQFHCNDIVGENGRVWTLASNKFKEGMNNVKDTGDLNFKSTSDSTVWELIDTGFVCEQCGSNEWITFSNKSGVPDGKNVQLQHKGPTKFYLVINKIWKDADGVVIEKPDGLKAIFDVTTDGVNNFVNEVNKDGSIKGALEGVSVGKYLVNISNDDYIITERAIEGYLPEENPINVSVANKVATFVNVESIIVLPPEDEFTGFYFKGSQLEPTDPPSGVPFTPGNHDTIYFFIDRIQDGDIIDSGSYWCNEVIAPTNPGKPWCFTVDGEYGYWSVKVVIYSRDSANGTHGWNVEIASLVINYTLYE